MVPRVRLLGLPRIEGDGRPYRRPRGLKSWGLLARVALAPRPLERRELAAELFSDADDPLGALRWCLADLRRSLAVPALLRGDPLRLGRDELRLDVWELEDGSLPAGDIGGVLLDGVELRQCPAFETWLLLARQRCAVRSMEELRQRTLDLLAQGNLEEATAAAGQAARLDPLDEDAQELFLRTLVAAGHTGPAAMHLASCEATFAREGLVPSPALRAAARDPARPRSRVSAGVVAASLLRAGTAALDAGAADAGIETLRRAAEEADRTRDKALQADVLRALGGALVHAVRGYDGEGAVILHRALLAARAADRRAAVAEILRELAFVDVQAGRHASAARALQAAAREAVAAADDRLIAGILAIRGMNEADRGRHTAASVLLTESADLARTAGHPRQEAWSLGILARSLLLAGRRAQAQDAAERSIALAHHERWNAYLPWPQVLRAQCLAETGRRDEAHEDAEHAFALACELNDPCWEGMAGRALGMLAWQAGDLTAAQTWIADARNRCDRVSDRYVWVSAYIGLAEVQIAARHHTDLVAPLAARLHDDAIRSDLPEFLAWSLVYQAEGGDHVRIPLARTTADGVDNPALKARVDALSGAGRSWQDRSM